MIRIVAPRYFSSRYFPFAAIRAAAATARAWLPAFVGPIPNRTQTPAYIQRKLMLLTIPKPSYSLCNPFSLLFDMDAQYKTARESDALAARHGWLNARCSEFRL